MKGPVKSKETIFKLIYLLLRSKDLWPVTSGYIRKGTEIWCLAFFKVPTKALSTSCQTSRTNDKLFDQNIFAWGYSVILLAMTSIL